MKGKCQCELEIPRITNRVIHKIWVKGKVLDKWEESIKMWWIACSIRGAKNQEIFRKILPKQWRNKNRNMTDKYFQIGYLKYSGNARVTVYKPHRKMTNHPEFSKNPKLTVLLTVWGSMKRFISYIRIWKMQYLRVIWKQPT